MLTRELAKLTEVHGIGLNTGLLKLAGVLAMGGTVFPHAVPSLAVSFCLPRPLSGTSSKSKQAQQLLKLCSETPVYCD